MSLSRAWTLFRLYFDPYFPVTNPPPYAPVDSGKQKEKKRHCGRHNAPVIHNHFHTPGAYEVVVGKKGSKACDSDSE